VSDVGDVREEGTRMSRRPWLIVVVAPLVIAVATFAVGGIGASAVPDNIRLT